MIDFIFTETRINSVAVKADISEKGKKWYKNNSHNNPKWIREVTQGRGPGNESPVNEIFSYYSGTAIQGPLLGPRQGSLE